jgi:hypothetical protein
MRGNTVIALFTAIALVGCAVHGPARPQPEADDRAGAVAANFWYVPGRALVCGAGAALAGVVMIVTFGQTYDSASEVMHGACSGPWRVDEEDVRQSVP